MKNKRVIAVIATVALLSIASVGSVFAENETTINSKGKILTSSDEVLFDASDFTTLSNRLDEVFQFVSEGKALIASAITDKGVDTAADATFQTMADNIAAMAEKQYNDGKKASLLKKVKLGSSLDTTYNLTSYEGWKSFTNSNFSISVTSASITNSKSIGSEYTTTHYAPSYSYNATTGILTVSNYSFSTGSSKIHDNGMPCDIYLFYNGE